MTTRWLTALLSTLLAALLALPACGLLPRTVSDYGLHAMRDDDRSDWFSPSFRHKNVWSKNLHRMLLNSPLNPVNDAHRAVDLAFFGVKEAATQLKKMEEDGARFQVKTTAAGKFTLEAFKPLSAASLAEDALDKLIPYGNDEDYAALMLNNVGRGLNTIQNSSVFEMEKLYFATAQELESLRNGRPIDFEMPEGHTREDYVQVVEYVMVAYHNDYQEIMTSRAALVSVMAAVASIDSDNGGGVANVYLVLDKTLDDRKAAERRRKELSVFPPKDPAAISAQADAIRAEVLAMPQYTAWKERSHAWAELSNFGSHVGQAFSDLSAVYGFIGGVDIIGGIEERVAKGIDFELMMEISLAVVPSGSNLHGLLKTGQSLHKRATDVMDKAERVADAVQNPDASQLLLWAAPDEAREAVKRVERLQKPRY